MNILICEKSIHIGWISLTILQWVTDYTEIEESTEDIARQVI